jgi:hypothetical protein
MALTAYLPHLAPNDGLPRVMDFPTMQPMMPWFYLRTAIAWLIGAALVLAGALLVLQLAALLVWQYSVALDTRAWPKLPLLVVFADPAKLSATTAKFMAVIPAVEWSWLRDPQNATTVPHMAATWLLGQLHVGLVPAIVGLIVAYFGVNVMLHQRARYAAARRERDDRLRRVRAYRRDPRTEPNFSDPRTEPSFDELRTEPTLSERRREPRLSA